MSAIMEKDIERFIKLAQIAKTTKELYSHYLLELSAWIDDRGMMPMQLNDEDLIDFLDLHENWSGSTRHSVVAAAHAYYNYRYGPAHPVLKAKVRRGKPGPQRTLTADNVMKLLTSFDTNTAEGVRNLAMVCLMLDTGLRAAEVCRVEVGYLDLTHCHLDVIIKGGDWGEGVYSPYTASCLSAWLSVRERIALAEVKTVFVATRGISRGKALDRNGLRMLFRRMGKVAGIGELSPHDLRRTFATIATDAGAPTRTVQMAGRWSNMDMVERYTKRLSGKAMRNYFPVSIVMGWGKEEEV